MKTSLSNRETLTRITLAFLGCIVAALIVEGACRVLPLDWSEERARFYQYDSELGWRGKPGASGDFRTIDFSSWVQQNSLGLRGPEIPYAKATDERRLLVLGDSFVWGYGVNEGDRFTEVMGRELPGATIVNAGCSGYGTDQELLFFRAEGRKYDADTVIVALHLRSDVKNNISSRQYTSYKPVIWSERGEITFKNIPVVKSSVGYATLRALQKRSAFVVWLSGRYVGEFKIGRGLADALNWLLGDADPPEMVSNLSPVEATCQLASMLTAEIKQSNARPVFLVIPDIRPETRQIEEKPEFVAIRECLSKLPAQVIDLGEPLASALIKDAMDPVIFADDLHWTPHGHKVVGQAVVAALKTNP